MNILIAGHVCIDSNVTEHATYTGAGSPAMFMEKIFRQIPGTTVGIAASYGPDFLTYSNAIHLIPATPNIDKTMVYENTVIDGVRTQRCQNADLSVPPVLSEELINTVSLADIICIAPLAPNVSAAYVARMVSHKKKDSIVVLLPQGYFRAIDGENQVLLREFTEESEILPLVDVAIVSDQDHTGMDALATRWADEYGVIVAMTRAENGVDLFMKQQRVNIPTTPVRADEIISSVGAGDIFSAGFMYAYRNSYDPRQAAAFGNALARQCLFFTPDSIQIHIP